MIFDDLINIKLYKGIHPNLDQAIDFLYEHRKDSFELGRYENVSVKDNDEDFKKGVIFA